MKSKNQSNKALPKLDGGDDNPYFTNKQGYTQSNDALKAEVATWKHITWFCNLITMLAVCGMIYAAQLPTVVPFMFKEDASGGITALGLAQQEMHVDNKMIANQLATFLTALREVPLSMGIKSQYAKRVSFMSTQQLFSSKFAPMMISRYKDAGTKEVIVNVTAIMPEKTGLWQIQWTETSQGVETGRYIGLITYEKNNDFKNSEAMISNPLGLVITDININTEIGSETK